MRDGGDIVELAKITGKGQITLPVNIRRALNLKDGDKVAFIKNEGQYILVNPVSLALRDIQKNFEGEAERLGLKDMDDVVDLVKDIRRSREN